MLKDFVEIGKFGKPFGTGGKLKLQAEDEIVNVLRQKKVFFLKHGGHYVPYFVEKVEESHDILLKVEDINDPQNARVCSGEHLYLPIKDLPAIKEKPGLYFSVLTDFDMYNQDDVHVGKIIEIVSMPQQELAQIERPTGEVILIPLHESLIVDIVPESKKIVLEIADGLLEL